VNQEESEHNEVDGMKGVDSKVEGPGSAVSSPSVSSPQICQLFNQCTVHTVLSLSCLCYTVSHACNSPD